MPGKRKQRKTKTEKKSLAKEVKIIERHLKALEPEMKYYTFVNPSSPATDQATNTLLRIPGSDAVAVGTGSAQRIGDRIRVMGVKLRLLTLATTGAGPQYARVTCIHDRAYNFGNPMSAQDIYQNPSVVNGSYQTCISQFNYDYANVKGDRGKQFDVLYDKRVIMNNLIAAQTSPPSHQIFDIDLRFKNGIVCNFSGAAALNAAIYFYLQCGGNVVAASNNVYTYSGVFMFTDV